MKRDMDLVRKILFALEDRPANFEGEHNFTVDGFDQTTVARHVQLMAEAGLIDAINLSTHAGVDWMPQRLKWEGHDFLDEARNDTLWNKAKSKISEAGVGATVEVMKQTLKTLAMQAIATVM